MLSKLLLCLVVLSIPVSAFAGEMLFPDGVEYYNAALNEQRAGKLEKALGDYQNALMVMVPSDQIFRKYVLNNTAIMAAVQGEYDQAESLWQEALKIDPKYRLAAANLGLFYMRRGLPDQALQVFMTAFDLPRSYTLESEKQVDEKGIFSDKKR